MAIAQHGRLAGRMQPVGINQRVPFGGNDFDVLEPGGFQAVRHELRGALHVGCAIRSYAPKLRASAQKRASADASVTITAGAGLTTRTMSRISRHVPSGSVASVRMTWCGSA